MPNIDDASVKLLYAADTATKFTIDDLPLNDGFDVIMDIEIGSNLNQIATSFNARVGVRNLTQSTSVTVVTQNGALVPSAATRREPVTLSVPAGAVAAAGSVVGDILQLVGSYTVQAGVRRDVSMAESPTFIVSA